MKRSWIPVACLLAFSACVPDYVKKDRASVYLRITKDVDEEERSRIDTALATPPRGVESDPVDADPDEGAGWAELAAQFGVAGPDGVARAS